MPAPVRVLVVDDSAFMRNAVSRLLGADPRFEVVGQAADGLSAVTEALRLAPDVITMDFNMPGQDGAAATRAILARRPVPIVMLSAHTREGAEATVEALAAGAVDFVAKPQGEVSADLSAIRATLAERLLAAAGANLAHPPAAGQTASRPFPERRVVSPAARAVPAGLRVVVIAASTGGPAALAEVVPRLTLGSRAALIVVQHLPEGFTGPLAAQLAARAPFPVREASAGEVITAGVALVAPGGQHLEVDRGGRVVLTGAAPVHGVRPAADVTLRSVAACYGARGLGVVLTGMGKDGALGLATLKAAGGRTIAQDRQTSVVFGMPRAAAELGVVDEVVPLAEIPAAVERGLA